MEYARNHFLLQLKIEYEIIIQSVDKYIHEPNETGLIATGCLIMHTSTLLWFYSFTIKPLCAYNVRKPKYIYWILYHFIRNAIHIYFYTRHRHKWNSIVQVLMMQFYFRWHIFYTIQFYELKASKYKILRYFCICTHVPATFNYISI